ncbi:hypothetical protein AAG570_004732 [Ranatra chinensis]|uniref:Glutaminyl-peptide cyclotransferase n=1 Tax=Ranatra chinensis TaxID=642074 RepID=A0ABD0Y1Q2_9HEMI
MIPRVVGTRNHEKVKQFLIDELRRLGWSVDTDEFVGSTPNLGDLKFTNVIGKMNPRATRYLALACHYDSKYFPDGGEVFLGATDSAAPCAMLLAIAASLRNRPPIDDESDLSLMLMFLDGEEAFHHWSETDSLYGARNLAAKWSNTPFPESNSATNHLHRIDLMMLVDLVGAENPVFYSYFRDTSRWHSLLCNIERRLRTVNIIPQKRPLSFVEKSTYSFIEDDHIPFMERGVPILHIIPNPFPSVWHTPGDNATVLDFQTIRSVTNILQVFVCAYLDGETRI